MKSEEHYIQKAFFDWLKVSVHKQWKRLIASTPNGGSRSPFQGAWLKAEGLQPGWPDVTFSIPTLQYPGMYIEFKKPGGRLTPIQKFVIADLRSQGYLVHICYSAEDAIDLFIDYIKDARCTILPSSEK